MGSETNVDLRGGGRRWCVVGRIVVEDAVCSWECDDVIKVCLGKVQCQREDPD